MSGFIFPSTCLQQQHPSQSVLGNENSKGKKKIKLAVQITSCKRYCTLVAGIVLFVKLNAPISSQ